MEKQRLNLVLSAETRKKLDELHELWDSDSLQETMRRCIRAVHGASMGRGVEEAAEALSLVSMEARKSSRGVKDDVGSKSKRGRKGSGRR